MDISIAKTGAPSRLGNFLDTAHLPNGTEVGAYWVNSIEMLMFPSVHHNLRRVYSGTGRL